MNRIFRTAILAMAMMISASFAWGQEVGTSSPNPFFYVYVKATLPPNTMVESITAYVKLCKGANTVTAWDEMGDGYYSYDLITNTFTFNPFRFTYDTGATYAEVCVRGYWYEGSVKKWYSAGQTFSLTSGDYAITLNLMEGNDHCPNDPRIGTYLPINEY